MNLKDVRVALIFKDFAAWIRTSCVGLNVAGYTTAKVLNENGIHTTVFPVRHNIDIVTAIDKYNENNDKKLTHVIISAPWLSVYDVKSLISNFKNIQFVILSHSNVGFLQADPCGVELLRQYIKLSDEYPNLKVGGNCINFSEWVSEAYKTNCLCLPNLYPVKKTKSKKWDGKLPIKIGAFGAIRPEKNFMTAAAAALEIHSKLNLSIEFHMITGGETTTSTTLCAIKQMLANIDRVVLIEHNWETWDKFINLISKMDLLITTSFTESFHMVTADGISQGVPSVISPVVYWGPNEWKADPDDAICVANIGINLLKTNQEYIGYNALNKHNRKSIKNWIKFLEN